MSKSWHQCRKKYMQYSEQYRNTKSIQCPVWWRDLLFINTKQNNPSWGVTLCTSIDSVFASCLLCDCLWVTTTSNKFFHGDFENGRWLHNYLLLNTCCQQRHYCFTLLSFNHTLYISHVTNLNKPKMSSLMVMHKSGTLIWMIGFIWLSLFLNQCFYRTHRLI